MKCLHTYIIIYQHGVYSVCVRSVTAVWSCHDAINWCWSTLRWQQQQPDSNPLKSVENSRYCTLPARIPSVSFAAYFLSVCACRYTGLMYWLCVVCVSVTWRQCPPPTRSTSANKTPQTDTAEISCHLFPAKDRKPLRTIDRQLQMENINWVYSHFVLWGVGILLAVWTLSAACSTFTCAGQLQNH